MQSSQAVVTRHSKQGCGALVKMKWLRLWSCGFL